MYKYILLFSVLIISILGVRCTQPKLHAPGARVKMLADGFAFTEGPAADAEGNVYFTDQPNNRIMKWSTDGEVSTFMQPCGRSNGLYFDYAGNLIACADKKNELWSIAPDTTVTVLLSNYQGHLLNGPNDVWVHPNGTIYFTDPFYNRPYWKDVRGGMEQSCQGVYMLSPEGQVTRVIDDLEQPNGIVGTPDGKTLYVADIQGQRTYRYEILEDGSLVNKKLFCRMGSDGMTIDNEGHVYLTGKWVTVFASNGAMIAKYDVPENWVANVCFGGEERDLLFITASRGVYGLQMRVHGVDSQSFSK